MQAALSHAGLSTHELSLLELYSCFPSAVQICADALGIDDTQDVTVTGGMAAAGGPLNNYVFQATCRMVELLRQQKNATGLISSVSGMFTKQAYGLWSTRKPDKDFGWLDVSEAVATASQACEVLEEHHGPARIAGYTVLYQGDAPSRAIIIADTADKQRTLAFSEEATLMQQMMSEEWCGRSVMVSGNTFSVN